MDVKELLIDFVKFLYRDNTYQDSERQKRYVEDYLKHPENYINRKPVETEKKYKHVGTCDGQIYFDDEISTLYCRCGAYYNIPDGQTELSERDKENIELLRKTALGENE